MYKGLIKDKICFALDVNNKEEALRFVNMLKNYVGFFKVGKQLFTKEGPVVVKDIINAGGKVFLDLKYHDIPNTVASAAREVISLGVSIFNVHATGGIEMLKKTMDAVHEESERLNVERPKVIAVTVLTSINENILRNELAVDFNGGLKSYTVHLADLVKYSGLDGIVCSGQETKKIKERFGDNFFVINPGIRFKKCCSEDQKRVTTHIEAIENGTDLLVIGRPIRECINPTSTARKIVSDIEEILYK